MEVNLSSNGVSAFNLRPLNRRLNALTTIGGAQIAFALPHGVDLLISGSIEAAVAAYDAVLHDRERRVPLQIESRPGRVGAGADLEEHFHAGDLSEAGDLVEEVASLELNPSGGDFAGAELVGERRDLADAVVAGAGAEVAAALEEAGDAAGGRFVEFGFGGLLNEGGVEV